MFSCMRPLKLEAGITFGQLPLFSVLNRSASFSPRPNPHFPTSIERANPSSVSRPPPAVSTEHRPPSTAARRTWPHLTWTAPRHPRRPHPPRPHPRLCLCFPAGELVVPLCLCLCLSPSPLPSAARARSCRGLAKVLPEFWSEFTHIFRFCNMSCQVLLEC